MALNTFAALKASIADYLVDDNLTAVIPDFITLCETRFHRDLRIREMEKQSTLTLSSGTATVAIPADFIEARAMLLNSATPRVLTVKTPVQFFTDHSSQTNGTPESYAIIADNFHFGPTPSSGLTATLTYYAKVTVLSDANTSNAVLVAAPDLYLYGSLLEAAPYLGEDERIAVWVQLYDRAVAELKAVDERAKWSSGPLVQRVEVYGP